MIDEESMLFVKRKEAAPRSSAIEIPIIVFRGFIFFFCGTIGFSFTLSGFILEQTWPD